MTPFDMISKIYPQPEYIFTMNLVSARIGVKYMPASKTISLNNGDTEQLYETFMNHLDDLKGVYESLIDETSRRTFCGYWLGRITNRFSEFVFANNSQYLSEGFIPEPGSTVIDCGACDGSTAIKFMNIGYKVYGFEMDRKNFELAKKVADDKGFVVENLSLGSFRHEMRYNPSGGSGNAWNAGGSEITQVVTLDAYVRENKIPRVDFIKLDVEGAELDILKGARTCIARWKPILAISAYHKPDDFWVLMNFIKSVQPDYEFAMRPGTETREDEPRNVSPELENFLYSLGLEPEIRFFWECVLFAR